MLNINPNLIILSAFTLVGLATTIWGWLGVSKNKRLRSWPAVDGVITECRPESEHNDLLPHIEYGYTVGDHNYNVTLQYPRGLTPDEEFKAQCLKKYPKGTAVQVHYDPADPSHATILDIVEDNWFILGAGLLMTVGGIVLIIIHHGAQP
jgi:hypothetical protein